MRRREFVKFIVGVGAWPLSAAMVSPARAQNRVWRIGMLETVKPQISRLSVKPCRGWAMSRGKI